MKLDRKLILISAMGLAFLAGEAQAATEWNVSLWGKRRAFTENVEKLAELVEQKTNGEFKLKISYGGLSKSKENLDGIAIGAFEMAQFCSFYHKDKNPTITVTELPFAKDVSLARVAEIYKQVYEHPVVAKDLARWNATLLMPTPLPQYNIVSKTDPLKSLADFKGIRVRGPGGIMGVLSKLGAVKTGVPFSEVRQSMDSGVIDAATFAPHAHLATKTYKVGKWASTNLNLGSANCPVVVNTDALNSLSPENKAALLGSVDEAIDYYVKNYDENTTVQYEKAVTDQSLVRVTFTPEQTAELNKLAASVREDWIKKYSGKFDSKTLFEFTEALFAK
ncbi:MAG TPA: C4-dicarboxylate ABC transporter substrate-binding protein [Desulfobacterales bacterium]|nr:C4-dicarboxylate ABC transporter substrate-binding protein [Desulfobacterales bacterium]HIP38707.1 C4-dicarboxylate ABC transporter substrate-binding protein [Desulfocapsa sulfexigens]